MTMTRLSFAAVALCLAVLPGVALAVTKDADEIKTILHLGGVAAMIERQAADCKKMGLALEIEGKRTKGAASKLRDAAKLRTPDEVKAMTKRYEAKLQKMAKQATPGLEKCRTTKAVKDAMEMLDPGFSWSQK